MNMENKKPKQTEKILKYMQTNGSITSLDALFQFGIMRCASRIAELRKAGYKITTRIMKTKNRFGNIVHYARYSLEKEQKNGNERKNSKIS